MTAQPIDYHGYQLFPVYRRIDPALAQEIASLWIRNRAIGDPNEIRRRIADVVLVARAPSGEVVGVTSVYVAEFKPGMPYYFYRMFIQPNHRRAGMMARMISVSLSHLQEMSIENKPRGLIIETENQKAMRTGVRRLIARLGFTYLGLTPRNLDLWKADF